MGLIDGNADRNLIGWMSLNMAKRKMRNEVEKTVIEDKNKRRDREIEIEKEIEKEIDKGIEKDKDKEIEQKVEINIDKNT